MNEDVIAVYGIKIGRISSHVVFLVVTVVFARYARNRDIRGIFPGQFRIPDVGVISIIG
jgi:hypothetical protein